MGHFLKLFKVELVWETPQKIIGNGNFDVISSTVLKMLALFLFVHCKNGACDFVVKTIP